MFIKTLKTKISTKRRNELRSRMLIAAGAVLSLCTGVVGDLDALSLEVAKFVATCRKDLCMNTHEVIFTKQLIWKLIYSCINTAITDIKFNLNSLYIQSISRTRSLTGIEERQSITDLSVNINIIRDEIKRKIRLLV